MQKAGGFILQKIMKYFSGVGLINKNEIFFTLTLCFLTLSLTAQVGCPNTYDGDGNGEIGISDLLGLLALFGDTDSDSDGVWYSEDECIDLTACNYSAQPTEPCGLNVDCNGLAVDGCEVNLSNDTGNCGSCGVTCNLANATPTCENGTCVIASCNDGYADYNNNAMDGCEVYSPW